MCSVAATGLQSERRRERRREEERGGGALRERERERRKAVLLCWLLTLLVDTPLYKICLFHCFDAL